MFFFLIPRKLTFTATRVLYRLTYSNVFYNTASLDQEFDGQPHDLMSVCVTGRIAADRCTKAIKSLGVDIYDVPESV